MDSLHPSMIPAGKTGTPWYLSYLKIFLLILAGSFVYISISGVINNAENTKRMMIERQRNDPEFNINENRQKFPTAEDNKNEAIVNSPDSYPKILDIPEPVIDLKNFRVSDLVQKDNENALKSPTTIPLLTREEGVTNPSHRVHMPGVEYLKPPKVNLELQNFKQTDTYNGKQRRAVLHPTHPLHPTESAKLP